jgi:ectoine hydroxylase-related dioxygenase (phytanoyl-CoA dioxygenase family)
MFPDQMLSVMIALTECTVENGCLQVIKGSHKLGRVNHGFSGEQVGADMTMVNNALNTMDLVYCVMKPGDVLFFHSNTLHRSEANTSERPRWTFISAYVSQSNLAYNEISSTYKIPVQIVGDDAILKWSPGKDGGNKRDFLQKEKDPSLKETGWEKEVKTNVL